MNKLVKKGDKVVLIDSNYKKYIIDTDDKVDKYKGVGVFDPSILIDLEFGKKIGIGNKDFWILQPSINDKLQSLKRKAQIILPKDAAQIIVDCSIESGNVVLEADLLLLLLHLRLHRKERLYHMIIVKILLNMQ